MQPTGSTPPTPPVVGADEQALKAATDLANAHAPWRSDVSWQAVLAQGVVLAALGLVIWLWPGIGGILVLQLLGVVLLITAALSAWRLVRGKVPAERVGPIAFRSGVGLSVGLMVVIGSLIAGGGDAVTVALAIVLGVGLMLYALSLLVSALLGRGPGARIPWVAIAVSVAAAVVGVLLVLNARQGADALRGTFAILGIVLLVAGLAIVGRAWMLRSKGEREAAD